jgi:hypothetical protein
MDTLEAQRDEIIANLERLNKQVETQNSLRHMFFAGLIYGLGFIIGSAVLAAIVLGLFAPLVGQIPWVRDAFITGDTLIRNK